MIVAPPTASGSSAATRLRKTKNESRKRIGNASSSARAMSSETCSPTCSPRELAAADGHPRDALQPVLHALERAVRLRAEASPPRRRSGRPRRPARGRRRARSGCTLAIPRSRNAAATRRELACACAESAGAPRRTSATMSGDALAPVARSTSRAGEHRLGLRVVEVVAGVEQPEHRAAEEARRRARRRASPRGSGGAGGGSGRRGGRASSAALAIASSSISCGSTQQAAHSSLGASTSRFERGDHVQQHPGGEERPQLAPARRPSPRPPGARGRRSARARAPGSRGRRRRRSSASGTAATCGRRAGRCRPRPSPACAPRAAARAPPSANVSAMRPCITSWQARKSSRLVWKRRNR